MVLSRVVIVCNRDKKKMGAKINKKMEKKKREEGVGKDGVFLLRGVALIQSNISVVIHRHQR